MSVIKSGTPSGIQASSDALGQAVAQTTPNSISVTNLVGNILSEFEDAAVMMITPGEGQIIASSHATNKAAIAAKIAGAASVLYVAPDAGQTGRSLQFTAVAGNNLAGIDISDLTTAVKPKFTVESLVAKLLSKIQEREAAVPADANKFAIVVDQVNKKVGIVKYAAEVSNDDTIADIAPAKSVSVILTPAAEEATSSPLPFEGGAV